jgi:hypothetical protein
MIAAPQLEEKRSKLVSSSMSVLFPSLSIGKLSINMFEIRAKNIRYDLDSKTTVKVEEVIAVQDTYDLLCVLYGSLRFKEIRVYGACIFNQDSHKIKNTTSSEDGNDETGSCDWLPTSLWSPASLSLPDTDVRLVTFVYGCGCTSSNTSGTVARMDARVNTGGNSIDVDGEVFIPGVYGHAIPFTYHGRKESNEVIVVVGSYGLRCQVSVTNSSSAETSCSFDWTDFISVSARTSFWLSDRHNGSCGISLRNALKFYTSRENGYVAYAMSEIKYSKMFGISATFFSMVRSIVPGVLVKIEYGENGTIESTTCLAGVQSYHDGDDNEVVEARCVNALPVTTNVYLNESRISITSGHFSANITFNTTIDISPTWVTEITVVPACSFISCRMTGGLYWGDVHCEVVQDENFTLANVYSSFSLNENYIVIDSNATLSGHISRLASCWNIAPAIGIFSDSMYSDLMYDSRFGFTTDTVSDYTCLSKGEDNVCIIGTRGTHVWHDIRDEGLHAGALQILTGYGPVARDVESVTLKLDNGNYSISVDGSCDMADFQVPLHVMIEVGLGDLIKIIGY